MQKFVKRAKQLITMIRLQINDNEFRDASFFNNQLVSILNQLNQPNLAGEAEALGRSLGSNDVITANRILGRLESQISALLSQEARTISQEETPHHHIVNETLCLNCHKMTPKDGRFCAQCGHEIVKASFPSCRKEIVVGWITCPFCGRRLQ